MLLFITQVWSSGLLVSSTARCQLDNNESDRNTNSRKELYCTLTLIYFTVEAKAPSDPLKLKSQVFDTTSESRARHELFFRKATSFAKLLIVLKNIFILLIQSNPCEDGAAKVITSRCYEESVMFKYGSVFQNNLANSRC